MRKQNHQICANKEKNYRHTKKRIISTAPQIHEEGSMPGDAGTISLSTLHCAVLYQSNISVYIKPFLEPVLRLSVMMNFSSVTLQQLYPNIFQVSYWEEKLVVCWYVLHNMPTSVSRDSLARVEIEEKLKLVYVGKQTANK